MVEKPMSGTKKRASLEKQFQAFKSCAQGIINNGLEETDKEMFKPGASKTPRLKNLGILTRVATINANVSLTSEAKIEVARGILTKQKDYSKKNMEKVLSGEKWIKLSKLNTKGKPKWIASVGKFSLQIFMNTANSQTDVENIIREPTRKETLLEAFKPEDEYTLCGKCRKESKISRKDFLLETLDERHDAVDVKETVCQKLQLCVQLAVAQLRKTLQRWRSLQTVECE